LELGEDLIDGALLKHLIMLVYAINAFEGTAFEAKLCTYVLLMDCTGLHV